MNARFIKKDILHIVEGYGMRGTQMKEIRYSKIRCLYCGEYFEPLSSNTKYCPECRPMIQAERIKLQNERKRGYVDHRDTDFDRHYRKIIESGMTYAEWQKKQTLKLVEEGKL